MELWDRLLTLLRMIRGNGLPAPACVPAYHCVPLQGTGGIRGVNGVRANGIGKPRRSGTTAGGRSSGGAGGASCPTGMLRERRNSRCPKYGYKWQLEAASASGAMGFQCLGRAPRYRCLGAKSPRLKHFPSLTTSGSTPQGVVPESPPN